MNEPIAAEACCATPAKVAVVDVAVPPSRTRYATATFSVVPVPVVTSAISAYELDQADTDTPAPENRGAPVDAKTNHRLPAVGVIEGVALDVTEAPASWFEDDVPNGVESILVAAINAYDERVAEPIVYETEVSDPVETFHQTAWPAL